MTKIQQRKLLTLARLIVKRWAVPFEMDEQISGCDAVDALSNYVELAQDALSPQDVREQKGRR